jgi:hypothetical protein
VRARDVQEEDDEDREAGKDRIGLWRKRMRCRDKICPWRKRMCRDGRSPHCLPQPFPSPSPPPSSPSSPSPTSLSFSPSACSARPGHCARTVAASSLIGCPTCLSHLGSQRRRSLCYCRVLPFVRLYTRRNCCAPLCLFVRKKTTVILCPSAPPHPPSSVCGFGVGLWYLFSTAWRRSEHLRL